MKRLLLAAAFGLSLSTATVHAHNIDSCGLESDYDVSLDASGLTFRHADGKPASVSMHKGRLRIDGRDIALSDADRARVAEFEATVRALVPQAKAIARDAVDIAYSAVSEVAAAFSDTADNPATRQRLGVLRDEFKLRIDDSFDRKPWNENEFDEIVEKAMSDLMPVVLGEVVGTAISIALSGDAERAEELERRAEKIEKEITRRVDTQAAQLALRVATLCPLVAKLDAIEKSLDLRLDGNARLDLLDYAD